MRRVFTFLAVAGAALVLSGCCWGWCDPIHPRAPNPLNCR
jgi:hypothetical protein